MQGDAFQPSRGPGSLMPTDFSTLADAALKPMNSLVVPSQADSIRASKATLAKLPPPPLPPPTISSVNEPIISRPPVFTLPPPLSPRKETAPALSSLAINVPHQRSLTLSSPMIGRADDEDEDALSADPLAPSAGPGSIRKSPMSSPRPLSKMPVNANVAQVRRGATLNRQSSLDITRNVPVPPPFSAPASTTTPIASPVIISTPSSGTLPIGLAPSSSPWTAGSKASHVDTPSATISPGGGMFPRPAPPPPINSAAANSIPLFGSSVREISPRPASVTLRLVTAPPPPLLTTPSTTAPRIPSPEPLYSEHNPEKRPLTLIAYSTAPVPLPPSSGNTSNTNNSNSISSAPLTSSQKLNLRELKAPPLPRSLSPSPSSPASSSSTTASTTSTTSATAILSPSTQTSNSTRAAVFSLVEDTPADMFDTSNPFLQPDVYGTKTSSGVAIDKSDVPTTTIAISSEFVTSTRKRSSLPELRANVLSSAASSTIAISSPSLSPRGVQNSSSSSSSNSNNPPQNSNSSSGAVMMNENYAVASNWVHTRPKKSIVSPPTSPPRAARGPTAAAFISPPRNAQQTQTSMTPFRTNVFSERMDGPVLIERHPHLPRGSTQSTNSPLRASIISAAVNSAVNAVPPPLVFQEKKSEIFRERQENRDTGFVPMPPVEPQSTRAFSPPKQRPLSPSTGGPVVHRMGGAGGVPQGILKTIRAQSPPVAQPISSKAINLSDLPMRFLYKIFFELEKAELVRIGRTCKAFRRLSLDASLPANQPWPLLNYLSKPEISDLRSEAGKSYNNVRVVVLPDGKIAFATFRFIEVINSSGRIVAQFDHWPDFIKQLLLLPDGRLVSQSQNIIKVWSLRLRKCLASIVCSPSKAALEVLPLGGCVFAQHTRLLYWDTHTTAISKQLDTEHRNGIVAIQRLQTNPRVLLTMSHEGASTLVCTYDSETGKRLLRTEIRGIYEHRGILPDDRFILLQPRPFRVLVAAMQGDPLVMADLGESLAAVAPLPDNRFVTISHRGVIKIWDTDTMKAVRNFDAKQKDLWCLNVLSDGRFVVGAGSLVSIWSFPPKEISTATLRKEKEKCIIS